MGTKSSDSLIVLVSAENLPYLLLPYEENQSTHSKK